MTDADGARPSRGLLSWIRRLFGPRRQPVGPSERDLARETVRQQIGVVRRAFDGQVAVEKGESDDDADALFLHRPGHVLVHRDDRQGLDDFFREREGEFLGLGEADEDPETGLTLYRLPARRDDQAVDIPRMLDELAGSGRRGIATPDHILYVTAVGRLCPATEPELPPSTGPVPPMSNAPGAGKDVRVSVVDTGWYAAAAADTDTPWLASDVGGDLEQVNPSAIHEYAGHGTFVSGIIRCVAPAAEIDVEGVLTNGGAVYEWEIVRQFREAMRNRPHLISISAGTYTYDNQPLKAFEALAAVHGLGEKGEGPLVVAAAGNDTSTDPFWPAAFEWAVSVGALDANGRLSDFSNYGETVDVYAHGRDLVNAFPTGTYVTYEAQTPAGQVREFTTGLAQWSGTSFSTPIVTGAIAAYMSENDVSAREARDALFASAAPKTDPTAGSIKAMGPPFV